MYQIFLDAGVSIFDELPIDKQKEINLLMENDLRNE
jgi:hypothetical protein